MKVRHVLSPLAALSALLLVAVVFAQQPVPILCARADGVIIACPSPLVTPSITPIPTISPTATPTPIPSTSPTPVPTSTPTPGIGPFGYPVEPRPKFDPASYLSKPVSQKTVHTNLAGLQAAENDSTVGTVFVDGGGSIRNQIRLRRNTNFDSSTYYCDTTGADAVTAGNTDNSIWYGCFLVDNGVLVTGTWQPPAEFTAFMDNPSWANLAKLQALTRAQISALPGTTIFEPAFHTATQPSITVFQSTQGALSLHHELSADHISIVGIHVVGRQTVSDGGVRATFQLENCVHCSYQDNFLDGTSSLGTVFGGDSSTGNFAEDWLMYRNITMGLPAANMANVNGSDGVVSQNYCSRLGRIGFGGGVSCWDNETNASTDRSRRVWVDGNLFDLEGSAFSGVGNAANFQDPGHSLMFEGDNAFTNNWMIGGRDSDTKNRFMSNCLVVFNITNLKALNNYCYRTGQDAIQWYGEGKGALISHWWFDHTGGGGNATMQLNHVSGATVSDNKFTTKAILIGADSRLQDCFGGGNTFLNNLADGVPLLPTTEGCPPASPLLRAIAQKGKNFPLFSTLGRKPKKVRKRRKQQD